MRRLLLLLLTACGHAAPTVSDLTSPGDTPEATALSARALEAAGQPEAAWARWLVAAEDPHQRAWALARLEGLIDQVDLHRVDTHPLSAWLPDAAPLRDRIAWRLGAPSAPRTSLRYRVSRRLASWPGALTTPPGLVGPRLDALADGWRTSHDGQLASPREGAGLYVFELELPAGRHRLRFSTEAELTAWASQPAPNTPPRRLAEHPALTRLLPTTWDLELELHPGEVLELHAATRAPQLVLHLGPSPTSPLPAGPLDARTSDAALFAFSALAQARSDLFQMAEAELALHARLDRPRQSSRDHALAALIHVELARLALADRTRPQERQKSDALGHLTEALAAHPEHLEAFSLLTRLQLEDEPNTARLRLDTALASAPPDAIPPQLHALAIEGLLLTDERREAFARAEALASLIPTSCTAAALRLEAGFEDLRYRSEGGPIPAGAPPDPACLDLRWRQIALARETFALDRARALLAPLLAEGALSPGPSLAKAHTLLAQVELAAGRAARALPHLVAARTHGEDRGVLDELERRAEILAGATPSPTPGHEPLRDLSAALKNLPRLTPADGGANTLLREARLHVHSDGALTVLEHVAIRPLDKKAIETLGEIAVPPGAELLTARTWKLSSGRPLPLEPEDLLEKDTISLPALAVGDVAEWAWTYTVPPDPRIAPLWTAPPIYFDAEDGPLDEARLILTADPDAAQPTFYIDPTYAHALNATQTAGRPRWVLSARHVPQAYPEPLTPSSQAPRRVVHVYGGPLEPRLFAALSAELRHATRPSPAIDTLIAEALATPGESTDPLGRAAAEAQQLRRLYEHLLAAIDEPVEAEVFGPYASDASTVAHRRRGARALALLAACRALSFRCELALARPIWDGPLPAWSDPKALSYPLVVHRDSGTWLDPSGRYNPWGVIPPGLTDAPAAVYALSGQTPPELTRTPPAALTPLGLRRAHIDIELSDPGHFIARGEEALDGAYGASWRHVLAPLTQDQRARVLASVVQQALPGVVIEDLELTEVDAVDRPLSLRWRARGTTQSAGGRMASLGVALFPESLARSTVHLSARDTPLLVNLAVALELTVRITAPPGHGFPSVPRDITLDHGPLRFTRSSGFEAGGRVITLTKSMTLTPTIIAPADYAAWREVAQAVDRADLLQLVFGPGTASAQ